MAATHGIGGAAEAQCDLGDAERLVRGLGLVATESDQLVRGMAELRGITGDRSLDLPVGIRVIAGRHRRMGGEHRLLAPGQARSAAAALRQVGANSNGASAACPSLR